MNRLLAHNWLIPSKIIESTPSIENDELPPPIGIPGETLEILLAKTRIDAAAALHRAGVKDADLEEVGLWRIDRCARLRQAWCKAQGVEYYPALPAVVAVWILNHASLGIEHLEKVVAAISAMVMTATLSVVVAISMPFTSIIVIITLLPKVAVEVEARDQRVKLLRFAPPTPSRTIGLAWRPTSPRKSDFIALGRIVVDAMGTRAHARDAERKTR